MSPGKLPGLAEVASIKRHHGVEADQRSAYGATRE
jgi:hypothetical protein